MTVDSTIRQAADVDDAAAPGGSWVDDALGASLEALDEQGVKETYDDQDEFVFLESLLPPRLQTALVEEFETVRSRVHRNEVPFVRKGGNVGYRTLLKTCPTTVALYKSPVMIDFCSRLSGKQLMLKSERDDHACALYVYTRKGDYMSSHYDTCGCKKGSSYTIILGLINRSTQKLTCELFKDDPERETRSLAYTTDPGTAAVFCGSKLYHAVSELGPDEERVVLSLSYANDLSMNPLVRLKENIKDAILYFGRGSALQRNYRQ